MTSRAPIRPAGLPPSRSRIATSIPRRAAASAVMRASCPPPRMPTSAGYATLARASGSLGDTGSPPTPDCSDSPLISSTAPHRYVSPAPSYCRNPLGTASRHGAFRLLFANSQKLLRTRMSGHTLHLDHRDGVYRKRTTVMAAELMPHPVRSPVGCLALFESSVFCRRGSSTIGYSDLHDEYDLSKRPL